MAREDTDSSKRNTLRRSVPLGMMGRVFGLVVTLLGARPSPGADAVMCFGDIDCPGAQVFGCHDTYACRCLEGGTPPCNVPFIVGVCILIETATQACDDHESCTIDSCQRQSCVHLPLCPDDGSACTGIERCQHTIVGPRCARIDVPQCNDGDKCTDDSCAETAEFCPTREPNGCCHTRRNCEDGDRCHENTCDAATGDCVHQSIPGCCHNDANCIEVNRCVTAASCIANACVGGQPISCDDRDPTTDDSCDAERGCTHVVSGGLCDDGDPCTDDAPGTSGCLHASIAGCCRSDAECGGDDPCTGIVCGPGQRCAAAASTGFESLACVCRRPTPAACRAKDLPRRLSRRATRACKLVGRAQKAKPAKQRRLVIAAGRRFAAARRAALSRASQRQLGDDCQNAMATSFEDASGRASQLGRELHP